MNPFKDMEEQHVWAYIATMIATGLVLIVSIASYYGNIEDKRMEDLLNKGHDPLELACLFRYDEDMKLLCSSLFYATANKIEESKE